MLSFKPRKISAENAQSLLVSKVSSWKPFELTPGPVYIFLQKNLKLVAVKGPADFFQENEIQKYLNYEYFYLQPWTKKIEKIKADSKSLRRLVEIDEKIFKDPKLSFASFEKSKISIQIIGKVFGELKKIQIFTIVFFVLEFLGEDANLVFKEYIFIKNDFHKNLILASLLCFSTMLLGNLNFENQIDLWKSVMLKKREFLSPEEEEFLKFIEEKNLRFDDWYEIDFLKNTKSWIGERAISRLKLFFEKNQKIDEPSLALEEEGGFCFEES